MSQQKQRIGAGAEALMKAFPTLQDDFTPSWFLKAAEIVLCAAERSRMCATCEVLDEDREVCECMCHLPTLPPGSSVLNMQTGEVTHTPGKWGVEFVDPPRSNARWDAVGRGEVVRFADTLRANPGRWAVYPWPMSPAAARAKASRISNGKIRTFGDGFRAICRDGRLYICYEGAS